MKRLFFTLALCMAFVGLAQAQLSQGETYSTKIITGNRPTAGDWGLYMGISYSGTKDILNSWWTQGEEAFGLPLINLKYYITDRTELRVGVQYNGHSSTTDGTFTIDYDDEYYWMLAEDEHLGTRSIPNFEKESTRRFRLTPGVAYHFSPRNVLDVYVGANIPIGIDAEATTHETEEYELLTNEATGNHSLHKLDVKHNSSYSSFVIGIGAYIGLQTFVADLPLAVGLEYGLTGMLRTNDKTYHVDTDGEGNAQSYYTTGRDGFGWLQYDKLSNSSKYLGSDLRLTITYFFNNK